MLTDILSIPSNNFIRRYKDEEIKASSEKGFVCRPFNGAADESVRHRGLCRGLSALKDGTYSGTARGHKSDIVVSVTASDGVMSAIDVTSQNETPKYWESAK